MFIFIQWKQLFFVGGDGGGVEMAVVVIVDERFVVAVGRQLWLW